MFVKEITYPYHLVLYICSGSLSRQSLPRQSWQNPLTSSSYFSSSAVFSATTAAADDDDDDDDDNDAVA